jgi:hypothetical protein
MDESAQKIYAELLHTRLRNRMPEHAERLDSVPDAVLIEQDRRHTALRAEAFKARMETPGAVHGLDVALRKMGLDRGGPPGRESCDERSRTQ